MQCEICSESIAWTWKEYFGSTLKPVTCRHCGAQHKLRRHWQYWACSLAFLALLLFPFDLFAGIAIYISESHSNLFHSNAFKFGFPFLCGLIVFLVYIVLDKYVLSRWVFLRAKAT